MIRTLFIISIAGIVLATASLGGAFALGGRDLARHGWAWTFRDSDGDTVRFQRADDQRSPDVTRQIAWTGGDTLTIDLSADVEYVQGDTPGVTITGPAELVEKVRLVDGRLSWTDTDGPQHETVLYGRRVGPENGPSAGMRVTRSRDEGRGFWMHSDQVRIVVTAPNIDTFNLEGSADLTLKDYDQDTLGIDISGSGDVRANGRTRSLELDISGSGDADLSAVTTTDANVAIAGSGDARVAPTGRVDISISGSGDVEVTTRPATVNQNINGSGDVDLAG